MAAATSMAAVKRDAFDEIAPSSSAAIKQLPYDVFINHRGIDVKKTLATTIYRALNATGLRVFLDVEELELGDFLPAALQQAMASSSLNIAIFSEHYAQSPWCLAELAFMLQTGATIIPIFYKVQPFDLRRAVHGKGIYVDAFAEYEKKGRYSLEKLEEWKMALHKVSFYSGDNINNEDEEQRVVKNVVNRVMKEMKKVPLEVAKHPVGLNEAAEEFEMITHQCYGNVQIVGIWGMGGSGKTTLAKELYNKKSSNMERCSFLFDIRDAAEKGLLYEKQKKLVEDLGFHAPLFDHVDQGKGILASRLRSVSVFIVLDDVDRPDQLEALLPGKENFGIGSLIIVTTREQQVLVSWGISAIYKMRALNRSHAKQLFCWHAFLEPSPLSGFEQIVEEFLTTCQGLPLSLKVLGGQLYGKSDMDYWEAQLEKISRILPGDIKERLKVSYDALDEEEKEMFLDTACFFIGEKKSSAIAVWDGSGWNGLHGWERLVNKCLVELVDEPDENYLMTMYKPLVEAPEVRQENWIRMHDHLRDLGREVANRQSPYRLWFPRQIIHIQPAEEIFIRGIKSRIVDSDGFHPSQGEIKVNTSKGFRSLKPCILGLKIFVGSGHFLNQEMSERSRELVWLRCSEFEEKNLPAWLSLESLRILELYWATNLQILWEAATDAPLQLRELVIDYCKRFKGFPRSIGRLKHLKILKLNANYGYGEESTMGSLPEEFCLLQSLQHLQLRACRNLSTLPRRFGDLTNLRHLDLSCSNLLSLPSRFGDLTNLQHLDLSGCTNLSSLPSRFGDLTNLQHLVMRCCCQLRTLPVSFKQLTLLQHLHLDGCSELTIENLDILEHMKRLQYLYFSGCGNMEDLPHIENAVSLKELYLHENGIREVPANIGELSKLEILTVGSHLLTSLPSSIGNLSSLRTFEISSKLLTSLPTTLGNLCSLLKLKVSQCQMLECLPVSLGCLNNLENLIIFSSGVKILPESFTQLVNLQSLQIDNCPISELSLGPGCKLKNIDLHRTELSRISISDGSGPCLRTLSLQYNDHLMEVETLPTAMESIELVGCKILKNIRSICGLVNLQTLKISDCADLNALPCLAELTSLKKIELEGCYNVVKLDGLEHLRSLEKLMICDCKELGALPNLAELTFLIQFELKGCHKVQKIEGLEYLRSLEKLTICGCPEINAILSFAEITSLQRLELKECHKVNIEGLQHLFSLEELLISGCPEVDELPSFAEFTCLEKFELKGCHKVEKIEGLEELRSLEEFKAYTCLKVPCIISLEKTRKLRELVVVANEKSVVEQCIPTIQKWPGEVIICTRAVNSLAFPNLSVLDSIAMAKIGSEGQLELRHKGSSSITNAVLICIIIDVVSPVIDLVIRRAQSETRFEMDLGQGKWVWMGLFTQNSAWRWANYYSIFQKASDENNLVETAWLMTGQDAEILESFRDVFHTFAK
ncbi:hypothetical protein KI387_033255 [Taxus chinensis]|uniref:TIR domain-containing protein n=1 Tax=Taxus chinensis TaxID=29808 RepID=A0AA38BXG2_TAXCH|nr:hypothetical protein KI387_033255 [Taxus chinensis]